MKWRFPGAGKLRTRIILWSVLPAAAMLIVVAVLAWGGYQVLTERLVVERDRELTRLLTSQLAIELAEYTSLHPAVARAEAIAVEEPFARNIVFQRFERLARVRIGENGRVYVVNAEGRVIYDSGGHDVGQNFSSRLEVNQVLNGRFGSFRNRTPEGEDIVASFAPVPRTSWGLITEEKWADLIGSSQGYQAWVVALLILSVVVPAGVIAVGVRRITQPIVGLTEAAREVAGGNFAQQIQVDTGDELQELAQQFNFMAAELQASYTGLERRVAGRTRELQTLNNIAAAVNYLLDLPEILRTALAQTLEAMELESGGIYLREKDREDPALAAQLGLRSPGSPNAPDAIESCEGFVFQVLHTREPLVIADTEADDRCGGPGAPSAGLRSLVSVPLSSKGEVLGALFVGSTQRRSFSSAEVQILTSVGQQVGVAVENARLYEQARQLAVMEERNRLARDLHDSVTQALYGVTLYAEASARLLSAGKGDAVAEHLRVLRNTAQEALSEMRLLIFELRPPVLQREGLAAALQARLEAVENRAGLKTEFVIEGDCGLPPEGEEALYRIAQEALNNALKHSRAHSVSIRLRRVLQTTIMEITDDGAGFEPSAAREQGKMGLQGMEERVRRLGGRLTVASTVGSGTTVRVEIAARPFSRMEEVG